MHAFVLELHPCHESASGGRTGTQGHHGCSVARLLVLLIPADSHFPLQTSGPVLGSDSLPAGEGESSSCVGKARGP